MTGVSVTCPVCRCSIIGATYDVTPPLVMGTAGKVASTRFGMPASEICPTPGCSCHTGKGPLHRMYVTTV